MNEQNSIETKYNLISSIDTLEEVVENLKQNLDTLSVKLEPVSYTKPEEASKVSATAFLRDSTESQLRTRIEKLISSISIMHNQVFYLRDHLDF